MPTGIYKRTKERQIQQTKNLRKPEKGITPKYTQDLILKKLKKVERFKNGLEVNCKIHGDHKKWRLHSSNNIQCQLCGSDNQRNQKKRNPLKFIFKHSRQHAKVRNREFTIELVDLENLMITQCNRCALTGIEFHEDNLPSIDRIDSSKGYTIDNIQFVLIKINLMKSNLHQKEFIELCTLVSNHGR